ncbi:hypothetical protein KAR48_11420 [bacterium]|nr:hypothetical protein [bacterium]
MKKFIQLLALVIFISVIIGCATTYKIGTEFPVANIKLIQIEQTTYQEIIELFGEPWRKGAINGNIVLTYTKEEYVFEDTDEVKRIGNTLVIEFDKHRIVKNYYLNVPGKETIMFGYLMHKRNKEKEQERQMAQQNMFMNNGVAAGF